MSNETETAESEMPHQGDTVSCLRPLRRARMVWCVCRFRGLPKTTKVGADHGVVSRKDRSDTVPGSMRTGMPVQ
jgi:hypothetical protein